MKEELICSYCDELIIDEDYGHINGEVICSDCIERYCTAYERCGALMWDSDSYGDDYTILCRSCYENHYTDDRALLSWLKTNCRSCYENHYTRCYECDTLLHNDDSYEYDCAVKAMNSANDENGFKDAAKEFEKISDYKDSEKRQRIVLKKQKQHVKKTFIIRHIIASKKTISMN